MERILILDSDPTFSQTVRDGFERLGAQVEVVADGNRALAAAKALTPDLILLSVELQNLNGWVVCKKLRATAHLKDIPLFVLSSEATVEIFEQHRRLSARADDYIHKPVSFDELLEHVRAVLPFEDMPVDDMSDAISVDDSGMYVEEVADKSNHHAPADADDQTNVDAEIEDFTESAFGSLIIQDDKKYVEQFPDQTDVNMTAPLGAMAVAGHDADHRDKEIERLRQDLHAAREEIDGLMDTAKRRATEADRLQSQMEVLRSNVSQEKGAPTASGRELLDLRESLNRKDKEILDLRDQVTGRDRQLIEASDAALTKEREHNDLRERISALQKEIEAGRVQNTGLVADKAKLSQQLSELRERLAGVEDEVAHAQETLEATRRGHEDAIQALQTTHGQELLALRKDLEDSSEQGQMALKNEHKRQIQRLTAEHEDATVALRDKLQQKHETELRHLQTKHAEELALLGRRLEEMESNLEATEGALRQSEAMAEAARIELTSTIETLRRERQTVVEERDKTVNAFKDAAEKAAALEGQLEQQTLRVETLQRSQTDLQHQLDSAVDKITSDEEFLQRARKAIAITATLLDEQKNNRLA